MLKILMVEDEPSISKGLSDILSFHGFQVELAERGDLGLELAIRGNFDLLLLDVMLPGIDGFEICRRVREKDKEQPIIMLTAMSQDEDIINGLTLGADDYIAKPFSTEQLVLRIKAVLRRTNPYRLNNEKFRFGDLLVDPLNLKGLRGSQIVEFTIREIEVMQYLLEHNDRPVSQDELKEKVWGYSSDCGIETRTVDIHISKIRKKIETTSKPKFLTNVWGKGYKLEASK